MTQMEDSALNQDHSRTTSMPNHMAELASGNFDQELTLSLLGSEKDALDQIEAAMGGSTTAATTAARRAAGKSPKPAWMPFLMRPSASDVPRARKKTASRKPDAFPLGLSACRTLL